MFLFFLVLSFVQASLSASGDSSRPGSIMFMDNSGLNILSLETKEVQHVIDFREPCKGRGIGVDTSLEVVLWSCDDRKLHSTHYNDPFPVYEDFTTTEKYLKTGIVTDNKGKGYYSEFRGIGWRVFRIDLVTGITEKLPVLNVLADQDYGGGLTYYDDTEFISFHKDDKGQIAYTKPGRSSDRLSKVAAQWEAWESNDPIGYPCELGNRMVVPRMMSKETILLVVDVHNIFPPAISRLHLPPYDTYQGEDKYNRQPAIVLTDPENVVYTNRSKLFKAQLFGNKEPELLLDLGAGNFFGPIAFIPPKPVTPMPTTKAPPAPEPTEPTPQLVAEPMETHAPHTTSTVMPSAIEQSAAPQQPTQRALTPIPPTAAPANDSWAAVPFDLQNPTPQADLEGIGEEEEGDPWPFGNGHKWPMMVSAAGFLACISGALAVLLASRSNEVTGTPPLLNEDHAFIPSTCDGSLASASSIRHVVTLDADADIDTLITKEQFSRYSSEAVVLRETPG